MPLLTVRNDITNMSVDAIVNAANSSLLGGGGVDGAIHRKAGSELLNECKTLGGCCVGEAKITKGYNLPCKYIIHTVGPIYKDGTCGEKDMLAACYKNSLELAKAYGCETVAFPLISAGAYGYPPNEALNVATGTIVDFLSENDDMTVYMVIFDKLSYSISKQLFDDICEYIDENYVEAYEENYPRRALNAYSVRMRESKSEAVTAEYSMPSCKIRFSDELDDAVSRMDESFSQMLLRVIDEKGMSDTECYKRANIDRKLFSKIRTDKFYRPKKNTVLAFAIALELNIAQTREMLAKAGYAFSHSNKFDIIVEFFIKKGNYDIFEINEALFNFDQALLGG